MRLPAELKTDRVVVGRDSREQNGYTESEVAPLKVQDVTLTTGDYTVLGLEHLVAVERKSLQDFLGCCGQSRERFERELSRLKAFPSRLLIIEASWADLERGEWRSKITPASAIGSLIGWIEQGTPAIMAGDRARAAQFTARFLFTAARRRWRELRAFGEAQKEAA